MRKKLIKMLNKNLKNKGLTKKFVETHSIYEIEELLGYGHFRYSGYHVFPHKLLSTYRKEQIEKIINIMMEVEYGSSL